MKKILAALALCFFAVQETPAFKAEDGFGVGFILGTPSGLSGSLPLGPNNALNGAVGYALGGDANLYLQSDYVWIRPEVIPVESGKISVYYGPGAFALLSKSSAVGIRGVVGIDYRFQEMPLQTFLEVGPGINILPNTEPILSAGLGLRYFF